jgi:hypothetical protein
VAIVAAAGLFAGNANAADFGGDCCADLEERVAELEATTVRKGNRKVSLNISGFVGHQVMWWDDGARSDTYFGDGGNIFSRFRFTGTAKISPQMTAGFTYEFGIHNNAIGNMTQQMGSDGTLNGDDLGGSATGFGLLRDSTVWLRHSQLGMVKIGHGSTATDNLVLIDLGGKSSAATPDVGLYNGDFRVVRNGVISGEAGSGIAALTWNNVFRGGESWDTTRRNHVLYETPTLAGFTLQAAVAEDNFWDVALRYAGEFGGFRLAAGIGYQENSEFNHTGEKDAFNVGIGVFPSAVSCGAAANCGQKETQLKGSASIMHIPTGLFVSAAAGQRDVDGRTSLNAFGGINVNSTSDFWYVSGGISQNFTGVGRTVLFGEYQEANDAARVAFADVTDSKGTMWGLGVTQHIDAAAMELFATYKSFEADITLVGGNKLTGLEGFQTVIVGTRINF